MAYPDSISGQRTKIPHAAWCWGKKSREKSASDNKGWREGWVKETVDRSGVLKYKWFILKVHTFIAN